MTLECVVMDPINNNWQLAQAKCCCLIVMNILPELKMTLYSIYASMPQ